MASISLPGAAPKNATPFLLRFREVGILVFLILLVVAVTLRSPVFLSAGNLRSVLLDIPLIVVVAMGMTTIILSRNIDLSVGSTLGLCAVIVGFLFKNNPGFPLWMAGLVGIGAGALLGAVNGTLVAWLRVPAIIATLGTLSVYRGLIFIWSGGATVERSDLPDALIAMSQTSPLIVPWIVILALVVTAMMHFFLRFSRVGRSLYAIGSNPVAARLRGIAVDRVVFLSFVLTGALAGLAGVMYASRFGFVYPAKTGVGFELSVIAATIIGGTSILGGSGSVTGTVLGCLLLGVIENALDVARLSAFWQSAIYGAIILLAVATDSSIRRGLEKAAAQRGGR
ncbi:MAG TPA: ABC transporter permease [Abditibacterium sp.]|jgi:rhamnose transport system permease protein